MMQYGLIALIATCLVSGSDANAGSRVTTSWLLPSDGSYLEAANWSVGVPANVSGMQFDAVIDATGQAYAVSFDPSRFGETIFECQSLLLDSPDATLSLTNRDGGSVYVQETAQLLRGTLQLGEAALIAGTSLAIMRVSPELQVVLQGSSGSNDFANIQGFEILGGDLVVSGSFPLSLQNSRVAQGDLILNGTGYNRTSLGVNRPIDYDMQLDHVYLGTSINNLQIEPGTSVTGSDLRIGDSNGYFTDFRGPGSFINRGEITFAGGESGFLRSLNEGVIRVTGGELDYYGDNHGLIEVSGSGKLSLRNGPDAPGRANYGTIRVSGPDAVIETLDASLPGVETWANFSKLIIEDGALARLGSTKLSYLGQIERDPESRVEIIGRLNLEGGVLNESTFSGPVVVRGPNNTHTFNTGFVTNGVIDISTDWFRFWGQHGTMRNVMLINGDMIFKPYDNEIYRVRVQDILVRDGDIVIAPGAHVSFDQLVYNEQGLTLRDNVRSQTSNGTQGILGVTSYELVIAEGVNVTGHLDVGVGSYTSRSIRNEGLITSTQGSGRIDIVSTLNNYGEIRTSFNNVFMWVTTNAGTMEAWYGRLDCQSLTTEGQVILRNAGFLLADGPIEFAPSSVLRVEPLQGASSVVESDVAITLGGTLLLDLSDITAPVDMRVFDAPQIDGMFHTIEVSGLRDNLRFDGLRNDGVLVISDDRKLSPRGPRPR